MFSLVPEVHCAAKVSDVPRGFVSIHSVHCDGWVSVSVGRMNYGALTATSTLRSVLQVAAHNTNGERFV